MKLKTKDIDMMLFTRVNARGLEWWWFFCSGCGKIIQNGEDVWELRSDDPNIGTWFHSAQCREQFISDMRKQATP